MQETSKTKNLLSKEELAYLSGKGIDIGAGDDLIFPSARRFDMGDGDANRITHFVKDTFDYVFSSHCLEHMVDPKLALLNWWQLVRPGGYLFFLVPDEDLYEQGIWPSRFNTDHKFTFTISKQKSWSPVSVNVLDLVKILPDAELISVTLQDAAYDRSILRHGHVRPRSLWIRLALKVHRILERKLRSPLALRELHGKFLIEDQTLKPNVVAQIKAIVRKRCS